jgi:hypothetical protein
VSNKGNEWTLEMVVAFKNLYSDPTLTFTEIARLMSDKFQIELTKNACIGKHRRLTLTHDDVPKLRKPSRHVDAPILAPLPPRENGFALSIYQLREGDCKWPLGRMEDRPPYEYCGHPAPLGEPYCLKHAEKARGKAYS